MLTLTGVSVIALIYESANSLIYRAIREEDNQPIILKVLKEDYPTPAELARYRTEYQITKSLNLAGVVKVYDLQKYQNTLVMSLEDFGGESLKIWMQQRSFTLEEFLKIAIATTQTLGQIHAANIIHKDINPSNIVFSPATGQLKIIDFGISTKLTRENPTIKNPNVLEGTLAYMSPEQTGRMNRSLDYRTDFYSLGVTFYELLTNQLPFETTDALELVHCHIAKQPLSPSEVNSEIPQVISEIVIKLMGKTAEERYQSALGIKADLEKCLNQLQQKGSVSHFSLAQQDISDKFQVPQKLYGREGEIETLLRAFARVTSQSEMILIAGYSGIGKTALVQELYKPITETRGYFISGKFDQYQRNIPYSAVVIAFQSLVKQLLAENDTKLQEWRQKLLRALGVNGQVILEVIPEVELIIGQQPPIPELGPIESQNRFNLVFQNFIKIFTKPEHPLAIFIDDLQWADGASLKLMQLLMSSSSRGLFLICAYRDNEVSAAHPLMLTLDEITKNGAVINRILLSPLALPSVTEIISDTLQSEPEKAQTLAELVHFKTGGNPFFMNEFLKSLYTEELLEFDFQTLEWQWDLEQIQARGFTDNVVELMADRIEKQPENTQKILKIAACIGNQFDLLTLSLASERTIPETVNDLQSALGESLVVTLGNIGDFLLAANGEFSNPDSLEYKFVHDRIQQAAYSLIPENELINIHQKIGKLLLQNTPEEKREEKIFEIVNQLNFTLVNTTQELLLLTSQAERDQLAQLNMIAGKKAKASTAYQVALAYLTHGLNLLEGDRWQSQYHITLSMYVEAAEAAYLCGYFDETEKLVEIVFKNAKVLLDKIKAYEIKISAYKAQQKLLDAINTGVQVLKMLGINLSKTPSQLDILFHLSKIKLVLIGQRIENLLDLPKMSDPDKLAAMAILFRIAPATFITGHNLMPIIVFKQVYLSIKYGHAPSSPFAYASYGVILCGLLGEIRSSYQFANLAISLLNKVNSIELRSQTILMVNYFISHWQHHVKQTLQPLLEGYSSGIETGNFEYAGYSAAAYCCYLFVSGQELAVVEKEIEKYNQAIQQLQQERNFSCTRQVALNLMGASDDPCCLIGDAYDENKALISDIQNNDRTAIFYFYLYKLFLHYLFENSQEAMNNAAEAQKYLDAVLGSINIPIFCFYDALVKLSKYYFMNKTDRNQLLKIVQKSQKKIRKWSYHAPRNHLHKYYLVEAEFCRVKGKDALATEYYDRAIALAKENEYIQEAALAYELAAKFYLSNGKELIAKAYMQEARYCYQLWGATAKVKHLEQQYSQLLSTTQAKIKDIKTSAGITTSGSGSNLDLATVMKASQAISGEIVLDKLLSSLMKILIENAGAQTGYLILLERGKLLIEASGTIDEEPVTVLRSIPVSKCQTISETIVNYVARTKETVVLNDATREGKFTNDSYIKENQPKSILCLPLINQGKLISIVYLENNRTIGAFVPERQEILNLLSSQAAISIENAQLYNNMTKLNRAYERFVPSQFLQFLDKSSIVEVELGDQVQLEMSVLFSDIRDFTTLSESMTPEQNFKFINSYLSCLEPVITQNHGFIDKYIGDAIMALFSGEADNAVKAGIAMLHRLVEYNQHRANSGYAPIQNGIGINTGLLMLGTVGGKNRMDGTVISDAVNLASRVEGLTKNYGVALLITQQTYDRLQNPTQYCMRTIDTVKVKGKSQPVTVYEVFDADLPALKEGKLLTLPTFTEALSLYNQGNLAGASQLFADCWHRNPGDVVAQIYFERCQK